MRGLDLCSGIGGFSLGLQRAGMETVAFCEIDEFCRKILNKHWPDVPVFKDIKALANGSEGLIPGCDLICGGVPCQPFSVAGKQEGQGDTNRHLWPYMFEIVKQQKPAFVIVENVAGFVNMALDDVLSDLESEGYAAQSFVIPACAVDAKHRRDRVWIVAYSDSAAVWNLPERQEVGRHNVQAGRQAITPHDGEAQFVADTSRQRMERHRTSGFKESQPSSGSRLPRRNSARGEPAVWPPEPWVGRVADGVPNRVDRIKGLGNAVVPQVVEVIGSAIMEFYENNGV